MKPAPVLVVTGPTGAGKSTVCSWLAERGAWWIDADAVGHEMLRERDIRERLVAEFGEGILDEAGEVSRAALGEVVFADPAHLQRLNSIVHPALVAEIRRRIEILRSSRPVELIVVDAALHFQFEPKLDADLVLGITASPEERLRRVRERDGLGEDAARRRLERQRAVEASLERADAVLDSGTAPEVLREQLFTLVDDRLSTEFMQKQRRLGATPRTRPGSPGGDGP